MRPPDIFERSSPSATTFAAACRTVPQRRVISGIAGNAFYVLLNAVRSIMTACEERALGKEWSGKIQDGLTAAIWLVCSDGSSNGMNPRVCCDSCGYRYENAQKNIAALVMRHFAMEDMEVANWSIKNSTKGMADSDIRHIRGLIASGVNSAEVADMYCISEQAVYQICSKKTYSNVRDIGPEGCPAPNTRPNPKVRDTRKRAPRKKTKEKLKTEQVLQIRVLSKYSDLTSRQIGDMYRVTPENIQSIAHKKSWPSITDDKVEDYFTKLEEQ